jgi:type II secretory pathway component PulF
MPTFRYRAKRDTGDTTEGTIEAQTEEGAIESINQMGYFPIRIEEVSSRSEPSSPGLFSGRIRSRDITTFSRQLSSLLRSGVPILHGLDVISKQSGNSNFKRILNHISGEIREGTSFSSSLANYPAIFSPLYLAMVRAGESSGAMEEALSKIADYRKKQEEIFSRVRMALTYPAFMAIVGVITTIFMLTFVMPRLMEMFSNMGQDLPVATRIVLSASSWLRHYWFWILLGLIFVFLVIKQEAKRKTQRLIFDLFKLRLPILGDFLLKVELARFCRTLELLAKSGISILEAIKIAAHVFDNGAIKEEIVCSCEKVEQGGSFGDSLQESKLLPLFMSNLIVVGEESGRLDESLAEVASSYERDTDEAIRVSTALLEPLMILTVGLVVGFIVIAMLLPIFQINLMGEL